MKKFRFLGLALIACLTIAMFAACGNTAVDGVTLNKTTASVAVNQTVQLTATITPSGATNKKVTWSSDADTIATVSSDGLVTGKAVGTAIITVTTKDGDFTATCTVTVTATAAAKTVAQVTSAFQTAGYSVTSATVLGVSTLTAIKLTTSDTLMVLFYPSESEATTAKSGIDATASASSYICKQDGKNIYYGTAAAIAVYEAI